MLKPTRMTRILVGGHSDRMEEVIRVLHEEGVVHLEDFQDEAGITRIGSPLEEGERASDLLLRVRGLQKALDVEGQEGKTLATDDPAPLVKEVEQAALPVIDRRTDLTARIAALESEAGQLEPLRGVDVHLGALMGLKAVKGYLGTVRSDPRAALSQAGLDHEATFTSTSAGDVVVVLVRDADSAETDRVLAEHGFSPIQLPADADGTPAEVLQGLEARMGGLRGELAEVEAKDDALREKWGGKLASLEAFLSAEAERTQAPLRFGVTDQTFHVEGWVPRERFNRLQNVLASRFGDALYVEGLGDAPRGHTEAAHDEDGHHDGHEGQQHDDHHEVAVEDEAPTKLTNKGPSKDYQFMLGLLALPRYRELDPTKLIAFFFPIFFGLMVGDVVIGLLIMGVAFWLRKNRLFGIGGDGVAKPMMWGGLWAVLIGLLIFGEGLGMHFVLSEEAIADGEHSWETDFGIHFPEEGFFHKAGGDAHAVAAVHATTGDGGTIEADGTHTEATDGGTITTHAEEVDHEPGLLEPHGGAHLKVGPVQLGYYSKIHDVQALLVWSVIIGLFHLVLGLVLGVRNIYASHGLKLAIQEKVSWLMIIASVPVILFGMSSGIAAVLWGGVAFFVLAVALLWMGVQHTIGVGFIAILEIPSLLGNLLSYTRLAAIGASKAGMAIAFATIGFDLIDGTAGLVVYLLASLLITVLAILAGFLQSLRLQFVEFFSKFYEGGGRPYVPFGRRAA